MFDSSVLDMVVLLFFTYFICSVLVSVLNEMFATFLKIRANELEKSLKGLFFDKGWDTYVENKIFKSPYFLVLKKENNADNKPSYFPDENFAKAVMDSLRNGDTVLSIEAIKTKLEQADDSIPNDIRKVLLGYLDTAENSIEKFQTHIEGFYNSAMDRAGGWYKRKIKVISIIVSFVLVIFLNIDTIEIIRESTQNPARLKESAEKIAQAVPNMQLDSTGKNLIIINPATKQQTSVLLDTSISKPALETIMNQYNSFNTVKEQLDSNVYTIGYASWVDVSNKWFHTNEIKASGSSSKIGLGFLWFVLKLIGWGISVLALQVGSTYWFDALNKVINLRGTGAKPKPKTATT